MRHPVGRSHFDLDLGSKTEVDLSRIPYMYIVYV